MKSPWRSLKSGFCGQPVSAATLCLFPRNVRLALHFVIQHLEAKLTVPGLPADRTENRRPEQTENGVGCCGASRWSAAAGAAPGIPGSETASNHQTHQENHCTDTMQVNWSRPAVFASCFLPRSFVLKFSFVCFRVWLHSNER